MATSITTDATTTTLNNNGNAYLTVDTNDIVSLTNPLPLASGGTGSATGAINLQTTTASTSGTSIDYTSIPASVNRITIMWYNMSLSGTSLPLIQLGTGGSAVATGYKTSAMLFAASSNTATDYTTGFPIVSDAVAAYSSTGQLVCSRLTGNTWVASGSSSNNTSGGYGSTTAGGIALAGELDIVRFTTVNGTDTFDLGSVNISWEF